MANFYSVLPGDRSKADLPAASRARDTIVNWFQARFLRVLVLVLFTTGFPVLVMAQSAADYTVDVLVADQTEKQRRSAYWLALDRILRRNMPDAITDPDQRAQVLREASRYCLLYTSPSPRDS